MDFGKDFRQLGDADVGALAAAVMAMPDELWHVDQFRQELFPEHRMTQTLPLLFDRDFRHVDPTRHPALDQLDNETAPVFDAVAGVFEDARPTTTSGDALVPGYFIRAILTRLAPGGEIPRHCDGGPSLTRSHRVHIPLVTSDAVRFEVGDSCKCLGVGELWEINNMRDHQVTNGGDNPRIHLIVDYVVPGEVTMARNGRLVVC